MADVDYSIKSFENIGFKLKFAGYNDKLANFVSYFFDTMLKASREGLPEWLLNLSLERELKVINNANIEVD